MHFQFKREKEQKERDIIHAGVNFNKCGLSAVQTMEGEDLDKPSRTAQQHAQVAVHVEFGSPDSSALLPCASRFLPKLTAFVGKGEISSVLLIVLAFEFGFGWYSAWIAECFVCAHVR